MATQMPWAILLCKYQDDGNDPNLTTIADLYIQYPGAFDNPAAAGDNRTILELYNELFTTAGTGTYNAVAYWDVMSHSNIDVSGSRVFPCTLNMTSAEAASLYQTDLQNDPVNGGFQYQTALFQKAKAALLQQYSIDWKSFYGVAVSFQSPDQGSQGGWYDGGPGVFMDARYVRCNGMMRWGHEMGHGFGLDHSRTNGEPGGPEGPNNPDYTDPWDVMSAEVTSWFPDPNYSKTGPGLNAWNMRSRQWLDETRIFKVPVMNNFSETIDLVPLHRKDLSGYLGADLPGVGTDSHYLVEFRVKENWDSGIPAATVMIHRFEGTIGQFLGTHSYIMKGTNGQKSLGDGDVFEVGTGIYAKIEVLSIDPGNRTASVRLSYSSPTVKIDFLDLYGGTCRIGFPVEGTKSAFRYELSNTNYPHSYQVTWGVTGATPISGQDLHAESFLINTPDPSVLVTVSLTVLFDNGVSISDSYTFHSILEYEAVWTLFVCKLRHRFRPIPWWEWSPDDMQRIANNLSKEELELIQQRTELLLQNIRRLGELRQR